jgi:UDP-N-acetylmuramoyl-tripeptide--D-alanyl-D-alanine ligase
MPRLDPNDVSAWCGGHWARAPGVPLCGVSTDTRSIAGGSLFVALRGERFDAHDYLDAAFAGGAVAAVVEDHARGDHPQLVVPDTRHALIDLARGYRAGLSAEFIGITGSVGKTTVKELLASMLEVCAPTARTHGNWNNHIGLPLSLLRMEPAHRYGVFEVGTNHPGEIAVLSDVLRPGAAVMTTVGLAHLEFFASEKAIAEEKSSLLAAVPGSGWAVACSDQPWFPVLREAAACRLVTVSREEDADYTWSGSTHLEIRERNGGDAVTLELPLPGNFFKLDVALAVAAARQVGLEWDAIRRGIAAYRSQPMRWETSDIGGITLVNDSYNANPLSMREALRAFAGMSATGRRWLVLGAMLELGDTAPELHRALGRQVAAGRWAGLLAYGPWGAIIAEGAVSGGMDANHVMHCASAEGAAEVLAEKAAPGDAVLLKASRGEQLEKILDCLKSEIEKTNV